MKSPADQPPVETIAPPSLASYFARESKKLGVPGKTWWQWAQTKVSALLGFAWITFLAAMAIGPVIYFAPNDNALRAATILLIISMALFLAYSLFQLVQIGSDLLEPQKWFVKSVSLNPRELELAINLRKGITDAKTLACLHSFAKLKADRLIGYGKLLTIVFGALSGTALTAFLKPFNWDVSSPGMLIFFGAIGVGAGIYSLLSLSHDNEAATVCAVLKLASEYEVAELAQCLPLLKREELDSMLSKQAHSEY